MAVAAVHRDRGGDWVMPLTTDQVRMSATPGEYRPVLVPRGSSRPEWLPR